MSYINQDPDIIVPHKGKEIVSLTRFSWMQERELEESLSGSEGLSLSAACWCGETPGSCVDCQDCDVSLQMTKIHIGSGEDCDVFR